MKNMFHKTEMLEKQLKLIIVSLRKKNKLYMAIDVFKHLNHV